MDSTVCFFQNGSFDSEDLQFVRSIYLTTPIVRSHCAIAAHVEDSSEDGDEAPTSTSSSNR